MADEEHAEKREEVSELTPFDPTKKKKKKKVVIQDPSDEVDKLAEKTENLTVTEPGELNFTGMKKKKKKPVDLDLSINDIGDGEDILDDQVVEEEEGEGIVLGGAPRYPWDGTDRDYNYDELLGRVFNILRENNPDLAGDRRRTVMRPPQVLREGTKKTVFVNFMDLCKTMHRQPEHVMMFLLAEMGTSGSLDGQQRLVIKGRFAPKNFEAILRRYINEYVICNGCKSPDTILSKENRLFFLRCEQVLIIAVRSVRYVRCCCAAVPFTISSCSGCGPHLLCPYMSAKMAFDLLCDISPASRGWKIRARIARMWDYTGTADDLPPIHVDLVLVDEKGNAMYAEIPGVEADKFRPLLQESKVYTFSKFLVLPSKPAYKPFPNKYMIKLTPWTNVEQVNEVPADFPSHVFNLVQFSDLSLRVGMQEYFTDVIGMIIGVSKLAYVRMASKTSDTPKRVIALRDLANCEVKLVLWGEHALDFDADAVHSVGQDNAVVGIFVGTLMKAYNNEETLSGGSACKWYLNEDIPEINQFFDSLGDSAPKIQWISAGAESFGSSQRPARLEHKSVADLKKIDPWEAAGAGFSCTVTIAKLSPSQSWWFSSCSRCHRAATAYGSSYKCSSGCSSVTAIPKYRLCLIGTDGTDSAEFVLFGRVAQQVVGRPVMNLIKFQGRSDNIPKEIAAVVSQKFTFAVSVTERSLMHRNISFQVNGIETFFGRQGSIPQPREQGPSAGPSTPLALAASGMDKDDASQSHESTPVDSSTSTADPVDELPGDSKKRKSIVRHPLAAQKKLTFETAPSSKENTSPVDPPASSSRTDDQAADKQHAVPHEVDVSQIAAASAEPNTQVKDILPTEAKKKSVDPGSTGTRKTKPPVPKGI